MQPLREASRAQKVAAKRRVCEELNLPISRSLEAGVASVDAADYNPEGDSHWDLSSSSWTFWGLGSMDSESATGGRETFSQLPCASHSPASREHGGEGGGA